MKRDMEVIRAVLKHIQDRTDLEPRLVKIDGLEDLVVQAHVWMLLDAGMLSTAQVIQTHGSQVPRIPVRDLSWNGHELAANLTPDTAWQRLRSKLTLEEMASMSLKTVLDAGNAIALAWATKKLGLN